MKEKIAKIKASRNKRMFKEIRCSALSMVGNSFISLFSLLNKHSSPAPLSLSKFQSKGGMVIP